MNPFSPVISTNSINLASPYCNGPASKGAGAGPPLPGSREGTSSRDEFRGDKTQGAPQIDSSRLAGKVVELLKGRDKPEYALEDLGFSRERPVVLDGTFFDFNELSQLASRLQVAVSGAQQFGNKATALSLFTQAFQLAAGIKGKEPGLRPEHIAEEVRCKMLPAAPPRTDAPAAATKSPPPALPIPAPLAPYETSASDLVAKVSERILKIGHFRPGDVSDLADVRDLTPFTLNGAPFRAHEVDDLTAWCIPMLGQAQGAVTPDSVRTHLTQVYERAAEIRKDNPQASMKFIRDELYDQWHGLGGYRLAG